MRRPKIKGYKGLLAGLAGLSVLLLACSVDTPTAPTQEPAPFPSAGADLWKVTLSVNPSNLPVGAEQPAQVVARFESRTNPGERPPAGTTMVFTTTIGSFAPGGADAEDVVQSTGAVISQGKASAFLYAGTVAGSGTVTAQLGGSIGRESVQVSGEVSPVVVGVSPNSGPASGGTAVTIEGLNFQEPVQVLFDNIAAAVVSVKPKKIQAVTPAATPGEGTSCSVTVEVKNVGGATETSGSLPGAFTYLGSCATGGGGGGGG